MPPFLRSPQVSPSDAPFRGAQGGDQSPLLPVGVGSCLGTGPGALPYPVTIPGELVCHSRVQLGLSCPECWNTGPKENLEYCQVACLLVHLRVPSLQPGRARSLAVQGTGVVGILLGPPEMLLKPVLEKPSTTLGELENQVYYAGGPRGINSPSSEPRTKGLQSFNRQTVVGNTSC